MSCSISQPFRITTLPKISQLNKPGNQYKLLPTSSSDFNSKVADVINIAISGSSINQYIINPTPRLVFNYSVSSTSNITQLDTFTYKNKKSENDQDEDIELWVYASSLANNKNSSLHFFTRTKNSLSESNSDILSKSSFKLNDASVINLKLLNKNHILVVLSTGIIRIYKIYPHRKQQTEETEKENKESLFKLVNEYNTKYDNINFTQFYQENGKSFLFTLLKLNANVTDSICFKLLEVSSDFNIIENQSIIVDNFNINENENQQFFANNQFIQLNLDEKLLKVYNLSNDKILKFKEDVDLSAFLKEESNTATLSLQPIALNRVILNVGNEIFLLDLVHKALLSKRTISNNNNTIKTFQLLKSWFIDVASNGDEVDDGEKFFNDNNTLVLGVSTKPTNNVSYLELMNVNVGDGNLKESLGKSFLISNSNEAKPWSLLYKKLNNKNKDDSSVDLKLAFEKLNEVAKTADSKEFDNSFFKLLQLDSNIGYYDEATDRYLNSQIFINKMSNLLIENFISKEIVNESFIYLLTHPLFQYSENLLSLLQFDFRCYKQCILTCPSIPIEDLMSDLFQINNIELLFDLTCRIFNDFNKNEIKTSIKNLNRLSVKNFVEFVINYNNYNIEKFNIKDSMPRLIELLKVIIDSIGHFQLDLITLKKMNKFIVKNIKIIKNNNTVLNLLIENKTYGSNGGINYNLTKKKNSKLLKEKNMKYSIEYIDV
ncbi:hypothetical protein HANVADRAFT_54154 [Hanseniaspora valbyensis NRRL Y-1626]|uniref:Uncharacterized protein n=1 Tax=Hanseniaspora valbyensis NRRL Y-1626 TaxID=766949 RepID=A0A1B7T8H8_9ASCO|nr:hypothetical protein HANVADRAFT_54154 [Hanseniaspora valbyensis NRRL Y-1626]